VSEEQLRICIDVDDLEKGIAFYTEVFGLRVGRRFDRHWAELLGAPSPIDLLAERAGTAPAPGAVREYRRHWTPVHLDWPVKDLDAAIRRAQAAGATLDREVQTRRYGRLANLADPFGNGFCFLELRGRGYDEMLGDKVKGVLGGKEPGSA
jgi:catechol 2,3-dioxygenase-like lactoylglutathione lyase family enzyme